MYITHDHTALSDFTTLFYDLCVKWKAEIIKIDQIKNCVFLSASEHSIFVVRIIIALSKCVLRRIFETKEREAERYVTRIVCCLHIVLGWLDTEWKGEGRERC